MRITLIKSIATEYLGTIPRGTVLECRGDVGKHLIVKGFAKEGGLNESSAGTDGWGEPTTTKDEGREREPVAEDSDSDTAGEGRDAD